MVRLNASEARHDFAEVINRVAYRGERVVLHRRGKDVVALVSLEDLALLEKLEDQQDLRDARAALREAKKKGTKPLAQVIEEIESAR